MDKEQAGALRCDAASIEASMVLGYRDSSSFFKKIVLTLCEEKGLI